MALAVLSHRLVRHPLLTRQSYRVLRLRMELVHVLEVLKREHLMLVLWLRAILSPVETLSLVFILVIV